MESRHIPEAGLQLINDSFKDVGKVDTLVKNTHGNAMKAVKKEGNVRPVRIVDFTGRTLKHQKSIVILGTGQLVIGVKGQKYDDIPLDDRKLVKWFESDFE